MKTVDNRLSKNIWKEEKRSHPLVCVLVRCTYGPQFYDVHTEGEWVSPEICHVFANSIVFKQEIWFIFTNRRRGHKIGHFLWT